MGIRSRAQNFEDVMLWRALGNVEAGFFIDVGAQHPIKDSVSKIFSEQGWSGIHVEPTPKYSDMLRADRPNETVITAAVSRKRGAFVFFDIADTGLSTGRRDIAEAHAAAGHPYREITVPTLTLDDLLALAPSDDIHWLKIDVEGMEREVLESWCTSHRRPWIVIIEANIPGSQTPSHECWEELILRKGYHFVYYDGLNRFYISNDYCALDRNFNIPPNIFDGFQFDPLSDHANVVQELHKEEIDALESSVATLKSDVADMRSETEAFSKKCRIDAENRIADAQRMADAELANLLERERNKTEIRIAEIAARERDAAIAAAADKARLEHEIAALRTASINDRAIASAREADLSGLLDELRAVAAAATKSADAEKNTLAMQLSHSEDRMRAVINSRSWILSAPLRWLLREKTIDQLLPKPRPVSAFSAVSLSLGHAEPRDVMVMANQPGQSVVDLLSLPAPDFVYWSFQMLLLRAPSSSEQRDRERSLHLGCGRIAMIADIYRSAEAAGYRSKQREQGSNTEFVEWLYQSYLGRVADADGLAHFVDLIQRKGRAAAEADVLASHEAVDYRSLPYELERLVKLHQCSRQWWRWLGRNFREQQIKNIESEANVVRIFRHDARKHDLNRQTMETIRE